MNGHVFGVGTPVDPLLLRDGFAEYRVAWPKLRHAISDGLDDPRHVRTRDWVLGS